MKVFMTGATGTVGKRTLRFLVDREHEVVCLVRPKSGATANERLEEALGPLPGNCHVVAGDITKPDCAIKPSELSFLIKGKFDVVLHCAASTKMDMERASLTHLTNVEGTRHVVYLAKQCGVRKFHYISTAYVENGGSNVYEISKKKAETVVVGSGIPHTTSRISIVIGDSHTGEIGGFSGYYGFFLPFWLWAREIRDQTGLADDKKVNIPVCIRVAPQAILNLIPVDWVSEILATITEMPPANQALFVTHPNPPLTRRVIEITLSTLGIEGVLMDEFKENFGYDQNKKQAFLCKAMHVFAPYVTKQFVLPNDQLKNFLGARYHEPPEITRELLRRVLVYAISMEFGKRPKITV